MLAVVVPCVAERYYETASVLLVCSLASLSFVSLFTQFPSHHEAAWMRNSTVSSVDALLIVDGMYSHCCYVYYLFI